MNSADVSSVVSAEGPVLSVPRISDFDLTGDGSDARWQTIPWQQMPRTGRGALPYQTRCRVAYSATGMYFLVDCEDKLLTCALTSDYANLFTEDVVEIFLQPEPGKGLYLEYEISPLGYELMILVPNDGQRFHGWQPWNQRPDQRTRKATTTYGGRREAGAAVEGWCAEIFIPFSQFTGMGNCPPEAGTLWRSNIYRIDYDGGCVTHWAWCDRTGTAFHNYWEFGWFRFEAETAPVPPAP